jgi:hypothetical protein
MYEPDPWSIYMKDNLKIPLIHPNFGAMGIYGKGSHFSTEEKHHLVQILHRKEVKP